MGEKDQGASMSGIENHNDLEANDEDTNSSQIAAQTAGAVIAGLGAASGYPEAALLTIVAQPALSEAMRRFADKVATIRRRRAGEVLLKAATLSREPVIQFAEEIIADEELLGYATRIMHTAMETDAAFKIRGLSRALAAYKADPSPARLDLARLLETALKAIDESHIGVIHILYERNQEWIARGSQSEGSLFAAEENGRGLKYEQIASRDPNIFEGIPALVQSLFSLGIVEESTQGAPFSAAAKQYAITRLGERLVELLGEHQHDDVSTYLLPSGLDQEDG